MNLIESLDFSGLIKRDARTLVALKAPNQSFDEVIQMDSAALEIKGSRISIGEEDLLAPFEGIGHTFSILEK